MMISRRQMLKKLERERGYWRKRIPFTEFIKGVVYGLNIATTCVGTLQSFKVRPSFFIEEHRKEKNHDLH